MGHAACGRVELIELGMNDCPRIRELMQKYRDLPMDLADAALARVAERERIRRVFKHCDAKIYFTPGLRRYGTWFCTQTGCKRLAAVADEIVRLARLRQSNKEQTRAVVQYTWRASCQRGSNSSAWLLARSGSLEIPNVNARHNAADRSIVTSVGMTSDVKCVGALSENNFEVNLFVGCRLGMSSSRWAILS
jgi:hypothetical protein